jgi:phosphopantetheinyl transferase (holo-ACP synthase)
MNLLVAVLTSRDVEKLKRCIESVLSQTSDVVVVCNTLDFSFVEQARVVVEAHGIEFIVTESNGTPGKGKNSVKDYFLSTEFTHLLPVDGDDILLPNAVEIITDIVESINPDVIGLIDGLMLLKDDLVPSKNWEKLDFVKQRFAELTEPKNYKRLNLHIEKIRRISTQYDNFFNRFVLLSRKAASYANYNESLTGAEDIKQSLAFRFLHKESVLKYILLSSENIYLYDVTDLGAVFAVCKSDLALESKLFWNDITNEQINILKSVQLERLYD